MKPLPAKLTQLPRTSPIRNAVFGTPIPPCPDNESEMNRRGIESKTVFEFEESSTFSMDKLRDEIASLPSEVASAVKVHLGGKDGNAIIEIPLPGGETAWVGLCQNPEDSEPVVFSQSDSESAPTDISRTINPFDLVLGLNDIYSRLCVFTGADSTPPTTKRTSSAKNTRKGTTTSISRNKAPRKSRKRPRKRKRTKKKAQHARSRRPKGKPKKRAQKRKNKTGRQKTK